MNRRSFILGTVAGVATLALAADALGGPARRSGRRTGRRRGRRRMRRRTYRRDVYGTSMWVVPTAAAVGWELQDGDDVLTVQDSKTVEQNGKQVEVLTVQDSSGKSEEIPVVREDTPQNSKELQGSALPEGDTTTPGVDADLD